MLAKLLFPTGPTGETLLKTSECNCILLRLNKQCCWICAYQSVSSARRSGTEMRNETADCGLSPSACLANFDRARCGASSAQIKTCALLSAKLANGLRDREKLSKDSLKITQQAKITKQIMLEDALWRRSYSDAEWKLCWLRCRDFLQGV